MFDPTQCQHVSPPQLSSIGVANEEPNRRILREMLFTAPDIEKYISGVVRLFNCCARAPHPRRPDPV